MASKEHVSSVDCEDTRLTDAGRKEKEKEEKEIGRKEKEDRKEREELKENGQIKVTRGTILGTILGTSRIGTARRMVLRPIHGQLLNLFPIFGIES